ncbi:MAG: hypothetical protein JNJ61_02880 [Anaerolineae bacterium]|nr:hypothetical protein [Anaerolineae bacterium]
MNGRRLLRVIVVCIAAVLFGYSLQPAAAQCTAFVTLNSAIIYRNWVVIAYDNDTAATQITFTASTTVDGVVGSQTIPAVVGVGRGTQFALDDTRVEENELVQIEAVPNADCGTTILALASGLFSIPPGGRGGSVTTGSATSGCRDGRLNFQHCDKVALYPLQTEDGTDLSVWVVEPDGVGKFAVNVPDTALKQATDVDTLLEETRTVRVYRLARGGVQVNYGPDAEGKVFVFRFENWPTAAYPDVSTYLDAP